MARLVRSRQASSARVPTSRTYVCPIDPTHRFTVTPTNPQPFNNYQQHFDGDDFCFGFVDDSGVKVGPHTGRVFSGLFLPEMVGGVTQISLNMRSFFGTNYPVFVSHIGGRFRYLRTKTGSAFFELVINGEGGGADRARNPDKFRWYNALPAVGGTVYLTEIGKQGGDTGPCFNQPANPPFSVSLKTPDAASGGRQVASFTLKPFTSTADTDKLVNAELAVRGYIR
jgi:hypothetical protein